MKEKSPIEVILDAARKAELKRLDELDRLAETPEAVKSTRRSQTRLKLVRKGNKQMTETEQRIAGWEKRLNELQLQADSVKQQAEALTPLIEMVQAEIKAEKQRVATLK